MRVWILGLISLVLVVGLLVPGIGRSVLAATAQRPAATTVNVSIENFAFSPATVNVAVGSTVVWTQKDSVAHTVTSDNNAWTNSGPLNQGATFSHTFTKPGTYTYHCAIHPNMTGAIVVGAAASATTPTPKTGSTSGGMSAMGPMSVIKLTGWTGYYDGAKVTYITTDTSSKTEAARDHINYAPKSGQITPQCQSNLSDYEWIVCRARPRLWVRARRFRLHAAVARSPGYLEKP